MCRPSCRRAGRDFFEHKLGSEWRDRLSDTGFWRTLEQVPDQEYWHTAQQIKSRMLAGVRARLQREYSAKSLSPAQLRHVTRLLDPDRPKILTLGFARRFATYKRAALMTAGPGAARAPDQSTPTGRCCSCSPARPIRPINRASRCCAKSSS